MTVQLFFFTTDAEGDNTTDVALCSNLQVGGVVKGRKKGDENRDKTAPT